MRRLLRPDVLYILVCFGLILVWIVPGRSPVILFVLVMLATLPLSIQGYGLTFFGGVLLFGPDASSPFARVCLIAFWTGIAVGNMFLIRTLVRSVRTRRAAARRAKALPQLSDPSD